MVRSGCREGVSLVEVIVALVVLSVGVLGAAAVAAQAGARLREAEALEAALVAGAGVLDSLVQRTAVQAGERRLDRFRVRWSVAPDGGAARIEAVVTYHDGTRVRRVVLATRHVGPPPRLEGAPP